MKKNILTGLRLGASLRCAITKSSWCTIASKRSECNILSSIETRVHASSTLSSQALPQPNVAQLQCSNGSCWLQHNYRAHFPKTMISSLTSNSARLEVFQALNDAANADWEPPLLRNSSHLSESRRSDAFFVDVDVDGGGLIIASHADRLGWLNEAQRLG